MLTARVAYIQVVRNDYYKAEARNEHFGQQEVRAPRGAILDRNGYPLATTIEAFDVFIDRSEWRDIADARKAADFIAPIIGVEPDQLVADVRREEPVEQERHAAQGEGERPGQHGGNGRRDAPERQPEEVGPRLKHGSTVRRFCGRAIFRSRP